MAAKTNLKGVKLNKDLRESRPQNAVENKLLSDAKSGKSNINPSKLKGNSTVKPKPNKNSSAKGKTQMNPAKFKTNQKKPSSSDNQDWLNSIRSWVNDKVNTINKSLPNADGSSKNKKKVAEKPKSTLDKSKKKATEKPTTTLDKTKQTGSATGKVPGTTSMKDIRGKYGNKVPMDYSGNPARKLPGTTSMDDIRKMYGNKSQATKKEGKMTKTIKPTATTPVEKESLTELKLPAKTSSEVASKYLPKTVASPMLVTKEESSAIKAVLAKMAPNVTAEQKKGLLGKLKDRLSKNKNKNEEVPTMRKGGVITKSKPLLSKPVAAAKRVPKPLAKPVAAAKRVPKPLAKPVAAAKRVPMLASKPLAKPVAAAKRVPKPLLPKPAAAVNSLQKNTTKEVYMGKKGQMKTIMKKGGIVKSSVNKSKAKPSVSKMKMGGKTRKKC